MGGAGLGLEGLAKLREIFSFHTFWRPAFAEDFGSKGLEIKSQYSAGRCLSGAEQALDQGVWYREVVCPVRNHKGSCADVSSNVNLKHVGRAGSVYDHVQCCKIGRCRP